MGPLNLRIFCDSLKWFPRCEEEMGAEELLVGLQLSPAPCSRVGILAAFDARSSSTNTSVLTAQCCPSAVPASLSGALVDDTILSRQGVENFAKLPSLEASQGQTLGTLALLPSQTCSMLQHGAAHLTALLDGHIHQLQAGAGKTESPAGTEPAQSSGTQ